MYKNSFSQLHPHFMHVFFVQSFGAKNYKAETFGFETFWQKVEKHTHKMLMKLTPKRLLNKHQEIGQAYLSYYGLVLSSSQSLLIPAALKKYHLL